MFTGLVEEIGQIKKVDRTGSSCRLTIACHKVLEGTKAGDSIAVNGTCTATGFQVGSVAVGTNWGEQILVHTAAPKITLGSDAGYRWSQYIRDPTGTADWALRYEEGSADLFSVHRAGAVPVGSRMYCDQR